MNKVIYICVAATMALASCSNDEVVEQAKENAISFRSVVGMNTRATGFTTADFQDKGELYVTTFMENGNVLYDETKYTYSGSEWTSDPTQYWLRGKKLSFLLTYPRLDEWKDQWQTEEILKNKTVKMTVADDVADQTDYLAVYVKDQSEPAGGDALDVELRHAFVQVEVRAKNTNPNYKYEVKGVRFGHLLKSVSFNFATMAVERRTDYINYGQLDVVLDNPFELDDTPRPIMGDGVCAILPPQKDMNSVWQGTSSSSDVGSYLSVLINLKSNSGGGIIYPGRSATDNEYAWAAVPVDFDWESGKKYIYTLDFSNGAGQIDPNNSGSHIGAIGTYILGDPMTFTVEVSPWNSSDKEIDFN